MCVSDALDLCLMCKVVQGLCSMCKDVQGLCCVSVMCGFVSGDV